MTETTKKVAEKKTVAKTVETVEPKKTVTKKATKTAEPKAENIVEPKASKAPAEKAEKVEGLKAFYKTTVIPALVKEFGYKNVNEVPKIEKIIVNMGLGEVKDNSKSYNIAFEELALITGQKPIPTVARKAISNFKLKEGMKIGAKVTLRGKIMYEFLQRLISIDLPRVRDFRGINPKAFDGKGNYSLGIKEQLIFPEISYEKIEKIRGMDICFVTTANTDAEALALLKAMGMPFRK